MSLKVKGTRHMSVSIGLIERARKLRIKPLSRPRPKIVVGNECLDMPPRYSIFWP